MQARNRICGSARRKEKSLKKTKLLTCYQEESQNGANCSRRGKPRHVVYD